MNWHGPDGNQFGWRCPNCKSRKLLCVRANIWVQCYADGTDPDGDWCPDHDHDWGEDAETYCGNCKEYSTDAEFTRAGRLMRVVRPFGGKVALMWVRPKEAA